LILHVVFFAQILPLVVGVRQYSARLEMFRQLAKQLDPAQVTHSIIYQHQMTISIQQVQAALMVATTA
jgi:hypothetical protein